MSEGKVIQGDCLEVLRGMEDNSVDAVVCDPPYGLSNTTPAQVADTIREWATGNTEYVPHKRGGFMGKAWDSFVPPPAVWDECLRVLKPGGHLVAFAGSRTQDLMGLSIRLAGFEMRDSLAWLYGSGFPKSHDVGKAIDKLDASDERRARALEFTTFIRESGLTARRIDEITGTNMGGHFTTAASQPAIATADLFDMLRPHLPEVPEQIEELVAQRTVESQNFKARAVTGVREVPRGHAFAGATYGGDSVGREYADTRAATPEAEQWDGWGTALKPAFEPIVLARKPLAEKTVARNVLAHGTGAINVDACRNAPADGDYDHQGNDNHTPTRSIYEGGTGDTGRQRPPHPAGRWPANVLLDHHAAAWVDEQSGYTKSPTSTGRGAGGQHGITNPRGAQGRVWAPGDEGGASRFFYSAKAPRSERPNVGGVQHPTVKPLAIMRWLIRLVTPPGGVVLDPFAGSGTTIEAALIEGFDPVGIEMEPDYLPLIQHRIDRQAGTLTA